AVAGRRGEPVRVLSGRVEGDPGNATAQLVAGWISARCGCPVEVVPSPRNNGPRGIDSVVLQLDQDEEVRLQDDRKGGAVIDQPFRPESVVALADRSMGELIGEELRRLDPDEPFSEALEAVSGLSGLSDRPAFREHVWYDPMRPEQSPAAAELELNSPDELPEAPGTAAAPAPTVPDTPGDTDEIAESGEHDSPADDSDEQPVVQSAGAPSAKKAGRR
ncbi:glucose-6-phosphate dehydrogenase, partial [Modestobacter sp. VKM Ac-2676]